MTKLRDIMTTNVFTTSKDASVTEVAEAMVKGRFGSAIVMQGSWVGGIFTERDVLRAAASGKDLNSVPIGDWMTSDPVTVEPDLDSEEALQMMATHGFRHLPVVERDSVVGVVSLRDVLSTRIARSPR
jgi:CBS domain-containing protein